MLKPLKNSPASQVRQQVSEDTSSSGVLLELNNFGVAFGKKVVLSEISLSIPEQGAFVLLGPSGTGKSTLLRTLAGLSYASPSFRTLNRPGFRGGYFV